MKNCPKCGAEEINCIGKEQHYRCLSFGYPDGFVQSVKCVHAELAIVKAEKEALRMVVVKWQGFCTSSNQVQETNECIATWNKRASDAENQLAILKDKLKEKTDEVNELSKDLCDMEDWLLGTRETWGACDGGKRLKERIRDLIASEGENGDLKEKLKVAGKLIGKLAEVQFNQRDVEAAKQFLDESPELKGGKEG